MEAKEIIIRLINEKLITGEEALILFEAMNKPMTVFQTSTSGGFDLSKYYSPNTSGISVEKPWNVTCDN